MISTSILYVWFIQPLSWNNYFAIYEGVSRFPSWPVPAARCLRYTCPRYSAAYPRCYHHTFRVSVCLPATHIQLLEESSVWLRPYFRKRKYATPSRFLDSKSCPAGDIQKEVCDSVLIPYVDKYYSIVSNSFQEDIGPSTFEDRVEFLASFQALQVMLQFLKKREHKMLSSTPRSFSAAPAETISS